ncbi:MAG: hypothetical protein AAF800_00335 [Planctomycetota bacterium]
MTTKPRYGFSLVEAAIATAMTGGLLVVAMNLVGASRMTQWRYAEADHAGLLADGLLGEILGQPYENPDGGAAFGLEVGETLGFRLGFDDADDYHGTSESPPTDPGGNPIPGADGFTRVVQVQWIDPDNPQTVSASETGVKRITVTVSVGNRLLAERRGFRAATWPSPSAMSEATP